jgi:hypothetical protein
MASSSSARASDVGVGAGGRASVDYTNVTEVTPALINQFRKLLDPQLDVYMDDRWCARFLLARPGRIVQHHKPCTHTLHHVLSQEISRRLQKCVITGTRGDILF